MILEAADSVGSAWRSRWDSLVLFTPRRYDALPGLAFPGDPDGYPTRDEVVAYLERYAATFRAAGRALDARALAGKDGDGFVVDATERAIAPTRSSSRPGRSRRRSCRSSPAASRPRSSRRTAPATAGRRTCPRARVLVVGGGNTGFQIAKELAGSREVHLAIGSRQKPLPQRLLGRDLFWWLTKLGVLVEDRRSRLGRRARGRDTLIGSSPRDAQAPRRRSCGRARSARRAARSGSPTAASSRSTR